MEIVGRTDLGRRRENNEDACFISPEPVGMFEKLMIVADGMGGLSYGEVASETAISAAVSYLRDAEIDIPERVLFEAVSEANLAVRKKGDELHVKDLGTTMVICGIINGNAYIANIGDSRLYLLDPSVNKIRQITKDHSYAEEMAERGLLDRGSKEYEKQKNMITRAVGIYAEPDPDFFVLELRKGDYLLLCTDGLTSMVRDNVIKSLVLDDTLTLSERADSLVNQANRMGGRDNITLILAQEEGKKND